MEIEFLNKNLDFATVCFALLGFKIFSFHHQLIQWRMLCNKVKDRVRDIQLSRHKSPWFLWVCVTLCHPLKNECQKEFI